MASVQTLVDDGVDERQILFGNRVFIALRLARLRIELLIYLHRLGFKIRLPEIGQLIIDFKFPRPLCALYRHAEIIADTFQRADACCRAKAIRGMTVLSAPCVHRPDCEPSAAALRDAARNGPRIAPIPKNPRHSPAS